MKIALPQNPADAASNDRLKTELYRLYSSKGVRRRRIRRLLHGATWFGVIQPLSGAKRLVDLLVAYLLFRLLLPIILIIFFALRIRRVETKRTPRLGRYCEIFDELSFDVPDTRAGRALKAVGIDRLPALLNILRGQMSFVGPRAVSPGELSLQERTTRRRYDVRPGLISLWGIRQRTNIDYGDEMVSDAEYVESQTITGDFLIALRAIPTVLYGRPAAVTDDLLSILNIKIDNFTMTDAVEAIVARLDHDEPGQVSFVNADCANIAYTDREYLKVLNNSWMTLADGIGMKLAGKFLKREIRQNVNGTDLFPRLCEAMSGTGKGIFLLGARPGIPDCVREWVAEHYPGVNICGSRHGYFSKESEAELIKEIASSGAAILLVAFGAPRQDQWIRDHLAESRVKVAMGVGGLFDFYSGQTPRAPQWIRELGLEWLYRFGREPRRMWRRYFVGNFVFLFRVLKERLGPGRSRRPSDL